MDFVSKHGFLFYEHSDLNELPLVDQLRLHRLASIVVGPHGGAGEPYRHETTRQLRD